MKKGFTLIELITAISIFIVVMTISMGSIVSILDANRKSRSLKTVLNNLNLAIESMSKEIRFGSVYHCDSATAPGDLTVPRTCQSGDDLMSFLASDRTTQITYRFDAQTFTIQKQINSEGFINVTAPEIIIDDLTFYVLGAGPEILPTLPRQPKALINIKGHAGVDDTRSDFILQTMVSQRKIDTL